jgi:Spy/CpxP family protein refolding chaperone
MRMQLQTTQRRTEKVDIMRGTKFVPVFAAALLALPVAAVAQQPAQPRASAEAPRGGERGVMLQRFAAELNLTAAQQAQLQQIHQRWQAQNAPLIAQLREAGVARGGAHKRGARWERGAGMSAEQRAQLRQRAESMTPEQRQQMRDKLRQPKAGEQAQRQRAQGERAERGARASGEQRTRQAVPEHLRPVMEQLRQNNRAAMTEARAVLTADQQARLAQLRQERGERFQQRRTQRQAR